MAWTLHRLSLVLEYVLPSGLGLTEPHPEPGVREESVFCSQKGLAFCTAHWVQDRRP